ncbi:MAG: response regulator [Spirochaetes bacterium]|nr:response regulator [Spirochaetota bacterium]
MARRQRKIRIFSALEVANLCGVVNQTAINWIRNGHLKAFMTPGGQYRVYAEDLAAFMDVRGMRIPEEFAEGIRDNVDWNVILIIDDDVELAGLFAKYMKRLFPDQEVLEAYDGFEAGRLLSEKKPGFVFLHIALPGVDGHAICNRIKDESSFGKPFVIAISGMVEETDRKTILGEGADAFLAKPFDFDLARDIVLEFTKKVTDRDGND